MGAAIQRTYKSGLWYGRSHPAEETINNDKVWSQPSMKTQVWAQPSINESCNDYPQNRNLDHSKQGSRVLRSISTRTEYKSKHVNT